MPVPWTVEVTDQFEAWWDSLDEDEKVSIDGMIRVLEAHGPSLGPPFTGTGASARHPQLRELRVPHRAGAICVLYASDEQRSTMVLLLGSALEAGSEGLCTPEQVREADLIYAAYLARRTGPH